MNHDERTPPRDDPEGQQSPLGIVIVLLINIIAISALAWPLIATHRGG
ncbi:MAG: hypothetical protein ACOH1V_02425 [Stenotrophomonas sp.]